MNWGKSVAILIQMVQKLHRADGTHPIVFYTQKFCKLRVQRCRKRRQYKNNWLNYWPHIIRVSCPSPILKGGEDKNLGGGHIHQITNVLIAKVATPDWNGSKAPIFDKNSI